MYRNKNMQRVETDREDYSVKGNRKMNIISYIVCVISAVIIWLIIMNLNDIGRIPELASSAAAVETEAVCDDKT